MKRIAASLVLILVCSCGDAAGPDNDDNVIPSEAQSTPVGTPTGQATTGNVGPAGGTLASADGSFALNIPAGALAATTEITIQPITNNAWGGSGDAYRLLPDGQTFTQPVELVFDIDPQVLAETPPDFLDVAVQSNSGYWYILKNRSYDANSGTVRATTRHFSDYSALYGMQLRPPYASVGTGGSITLEIKYCSEGPPDPAYLAPLDPTEVEFLHLHCDPATLGSAATWSVNGIAGGNNSVGRVTATGINTALYTAPASAPQSNPVAVGVRVPRRRNTQTHVSNITIATALLGTATADFGDGEKIEAAVTWKPAGTFQNLETFDVHSGSVVYTPSTLPVGPNCTAESYFPNTVNMVPVTDGHMFIDHSQTPPRFTGTGNTALQTNASWVCAGVPQSEPQLLFLTWFETNGAATPLEVSPDGSISKSWGTAGNGSVKYTVSFTRGSLPSPATKLSAAKPLWLEGILGDPTPARSLPPATLARLINSRSAFGGLSARCCALPLEPTRKVEVQGMN